METLTVTVSGKAYERCLNPLCTDIPKEEGWPVAVKRRRGRGFTHLYEVTPEQAIQIATQLEHYAYIDLYGTDHSDYEAHADGRACAKAAQSVRQQLALTKLDSGS